MSKGYGRVFARVYNTEWTGFVRRVAPHLLTFYASTSIAQVNTSVLDLCCGTGQLALYFLERGFRVTGIDLSESMLSYARENTGKYLETGHAKFLQGDVTHFILDERFGLAVSTYDSLNHLENEEALGGCFRSVFDALVNDGYFIFDMNTRAGLMNWNSVGVTDREEMMIVTRGIYDEHRDRALMKISGFVRTPDGLYERFEETAFNTVFEMEMVKKALLGSGFREVYFARIHDLTTPIEEPEAEPRVFIVARK
jgi:SAM-dependent methyltransferase